MTYNVHGIEDHLPGPQSEWENRKGPIAELIMQKDIHIFGLQEPYFGQVCQLSELLNEYQWYGIGLDDGKKEGQINAVFYKKNQFELKDKGTVFLSENPRLPGKGWGARFPRGVTWVNLIEKNTQSSLFFFNTHFDYHSRLARDESAKLVRYTIEKLAEDVPVILVGDFNIFSSLGGNETYKLLTQKNKKNLLFNAQNISMSPHKGPVGTWSGFKEAGKPGIKPDFIFVNRFIRVFAHQIVANTHKGEFLSDHLPVIAELEIQY